MIVKVPPAPPVILILAQLATGGGEVLVGVFVGGMTEVNVGVFVAVRVGVGVLVLVAVIVLVGGVAPGG